LLFVYDKSLERRGVATVRITMAEALVRFLAAQEIDGAPLFAGVWAIFGHGNVAGLGPALHAARRRLPTLRAHNEQAMAHAAIAFAKAHARRRMMACTTSIGPGATNMVTAAAVAHVNRLPVLLLPGDVFADRRPDPVLQQLEAFGDPGASVNDCFRPVSRYFDRITRPEQILVSLPAALRVLLDPADCGPVTLALPQDVQTEACDYPAEFFRRRVHRIRKAPPDPGELESAAGLLKNAKKPLVIAGGGVKYALAEKRLAAFAREHGLPVAETQAGKGSLAWDHACNMGAIGVTGTAAANRLAAGADVVLAIGTRLGDFATGSRALFAGAKLVQLNVGAFDAAKHGAAPLVADADAGLEALSRALRGWKAPTAWTAQAARLARAWHREVERIVSPSRGRPTDAQVLGVVNNTLGKNAIVVCAAGGLPGELHKLWRAADSAGYHLEYGYSCMGYEIAGGLGVKLAHPKREVCVLVGDGSYLMLNSEIATSVALGAKLTLVVLDNRGFGCIERLQNATGGASFNNLLADSAPRVDFAAHARSLGAQAEKVESLSSLRGALQRAIRARKTSVVVIDTEPRRGTAEGGAWWDVAVSAAPRNSRQQKARTAYEAARRRQKLGA
jgi:3D-(3,5/4)-trihydroxycyclohexane-1,2-dione acylhydrolase (decyclizing)